MKQMRNLEDVKKFEIEKDRKLHCANHDEILNGATTDIYFLRTIDILKKMGLDDKIVTAEIFPRKSGIFVGIEEVKNILKGKNVEMWAIDEGQQFEAKETVIRIRGPYKEFGIYETPILGALASACGWATAAREIREACGEKTFLCFGARHVHPAVAPVMERAAVIGGANGASCILAAKLLDIEPSGTLPHAAMLIAGDTAEIAKTYDEVMPESHKRIVLVDTFKDEVEESLRIAKLLGDRLYGIRVDTPSERGGVTPGLIRELRYRLDMEGYNHVKIIVSGGLTPEKIKILSEAGADAFGVGSYISAASPIDMTMDIKEVEGVPVAKRGRIPGIIENPKLKLVKL
ncbi:nicotinate phosphoribosyltransferase [Caminicella sporogenes DSM 14501]|uniref:Nicotinate phosphoribosyltransferase n=1 Tax=Caminicella sporogenes DSM 14501 TaxID=1121266 RepID=A0A1M6LYS2_9FIRM|nr:nicotinate phosphoribosyltransferase [Caminicella sporogenes]RKD27996.1 nicotinate phosphoribosyltransferase [Caminicella sporogenes]SHJ76203.1 nicotinate phosphoribosyltransferase [Caminicella sporogenes DSM 14501]